MRYKKPLKFYAKHLQKSWRPLFLTIFCLILIAIIVHTLSKLGYGLTYAASESMPQGFYFLCPPKNLNRYNIVVFKPPPAAIDFIRKYNLAPKNNWLIKYVFGIPGDMVCNHDGYVRVNAEKIGKIYKKSTDGKIIPQYSFCRKLTHDEYLLLSNKIPNSFDARYFGPVKIDSIIGKAIPLFNLAYKKSIYSAPVAE